MLCTFFLTTTLFAAEADEVGVEADEAIRLPEARVEDVRDTPEHITQEEMERDGVTDLWEAVRYVPGVILSGGGRRNDSNFTVRGYGADAVPIYIDGIIMANPYRGEGDAARFLTGDLESIDIQKGYSDELLGANTLGGAILMRTAKPRNSFEASVKTSLDFDSIGKYADSTHVLSLGSRLKYFYTKAVAQYRDINHFRLPGDFEPTKYNPQEKGDRLWSDSKDTKITLLAGFTPFPELDIWANWVYQTADKGFSTPETRTREYQIWDWPVWNRQSSSLNGTYTADVWNIEALAYFDKYDNRLIEYYNWKAYTLGIHHEPSDYDEYTAGGHLKFGWDINSWNTVRSGVTYIKEDHKSLSDGEEQVHVNEDTWSFGAEYSMNYWEPLTVNLGGGFNSLVPIDFYGDENEFMKALGDHYYVIKTKPMFLYTWQAGLFYKLTTSHELHLSYARKNHFPTMSDRYSTRFGRKLPNPNLGPEIANHFEFGYQGAILEKLTINTAVYYSIMTGKIVNIKLPNPEYPPVEVDYARNLDSTSFYGFEFSPELFINSFISSGASFSYNKYTINNSLQGVLKLDYYPEITTNAYVVINLITKAPDKAKWLTQLSIIPRIEFIGSRYADTAGKNELDSYFLGNIKLVLGITKYCTISTSVENIFDEYYEIRENWPLAGRSFNISLTAKY
ncbi:putative TonB-dependent receptor [Treponema primitia ZAS-2]|uniref:Putative TonB-dependent receptor n=1 Tax=Treponema primitia (strain ATCC BAA-887 / DSM 12427 / ZAS-2) TaxID=545694 RepID=F5YH72_TREPZ|nr:putative TonB-dependent receptor [Treponema primitia ZAS-2]